MARGARYLAAAENNARCTASSAPWGLEQLGPLSRQVGDLPRQRVPLLGEELGRAPRGGGVHPGGLQRGRQALLLGSLLALLRSPSATSTLPLAELHRRSVAAIHAPFPARSGAGEGNRAAACPVHRRMHR